MNIKELTQEQNEVLKMSQSFKHESQIKRVCTYCLQSIIIETNNNKYYSIDPNGDIKERSYHDLNAFDYKTLWSNKKEMY